jgi:hypothetical protein
VDRIPAVTLNRALAAIATVLGLLALFTAEGAVPPGGSSEISAFEVAKAIRFDPEGLWVVDIRDQEAWEGLHVPRAVHLPVQPNPEREPLTAARWREKLEALGATREQPIVIAGGPETPTRDIWLELRKAGYEASYMPDMLDDWLETIVSPVRGPTEDPRARAEWEELAELSRYFGGFPRVNSTPGRSGSVSERLRHARRRGCAI